MNRQGGLGRGLAALIPPGDGGSGVRATLAEIPLDAVQPNPRQPREVFDDDELEGLATSIADIGVLQPIVVRPIGEDIYELIAGERRLRAAKRAQLERIPAVVRHTEDGQLLKEALVENIHRVQLNPLEEAAAYQQLLEDFDFTQEELARSIGKSRPAISNALRLLHLPTDVQRRVAAGVLSAGHAKALLALPDVETMDRLATRTVNEGLSVRSLEELIRLTLLEPSDRQTPRRGRGSTVTAPGLNDLQDDLSDALQAKVRIQMGARKGKLQIEFRSVDDLERIVGVIAKGLDEPQGDDVRSAHEQALAADDVRAEVSGQLDPTVGDDDSRASDTSPVPDVDAPFGTPRPVLDARHAVEDTDLDDLADLGDDPEDWNAAVGDVDDEPTGGFGTASSADVDDGPAADVDGAGADEPATEPNDPDVDDPDADDLDPDVDDPDELDDDELEALTRPD